MDLSKLNKPLLKQVRDAIANDASTFTMGQWGVDVYDGKWWYFDDEAEHEGCDTPACIAGWAIRLAVPRADESTTEVPSVQGDIKRLAAELLGLPTITNVEVGVEVRARPVGHAHRRP
jgi:hypothetical protein